MKSTIARCLVLLACTVLGVGAANPAPRGPSAREREAPNATRSATTGPGASQAELESWLARLKGTFTIKLVLKGRFTCLAPTAAGTLQTQQCLKEEAAKGITFISTVYCPGIGEGAGVYCTFDALRRVVGEGAAETSEPAFLLNDPLPIRALFGSDPASGKISVVTMNSGSVVLNSLGSLKGNTVTFEGTCDSALARNRAPCKWSMQMRASPDGSGIEMKRTMQGDTFTLDLSRVE
jgi:hypothetical protein